MLLAAAHCIQDKDPGSIGENDVFEPDYTGELSPEDFTSKTVVNKSPRWTYTTAYFE